MKHTLLSLALALSTAHGWAGEIINQTLKAKAEGRVYIDNQRGNVVIRGWDKNEVKVEGELDDSAESYTFEREGNSINFIVDMPRRNNGSNDDGSKLEIFIPQLSKLEAESVNANYQIEKVLGSVELSTINGNISAKKVRHEISLGTINGAIEVEDAKGELQLSSINGKVFLSDSEGTLEASTINGKMNIQSDAKSIEIESVNGAIQLALNVVGSLEIQSVSGNIQASVKQLMKHGEISINTVSSPIELDLPKDISAEFQISNQAGGRINNQISEHKYKRARFGPGKELRMILSNGNGEVNINSISAKVNLNQN